MYPSALLNWGKLLLRNLHILGCYRLTSAHLPLVTSSYWAKNKNDVSTPLSILQNKCHLSTYLIASSVNFGLGVSIDDYLNFLGWLRLPNFLVLFSSRAQNLQIQVLPWSTNNPKMSCPSENLMWLIHGKCVAHTPQLQSLQFFLLRQYCLKPEVATVSNIVLSRDGL